MASSRAARKRPTSAVEKGRTGRPSTPQRATRAPLIAGALAGLAAVAVLVVAFVALSGSGAAPSAPSGTVVQGNGGPWTNITPDTLASMLRAKDFTLVDVKTPYIGEIEGTDLYIPYDQLTARASQLPSDKAARIVVYCRTGNESAIAAQTLLDMGYTDIWNLDGGMTAWVASGRPIIQKART